MVAAIVIYTVYINLYFAQHRNNANIAQSTPWAGQQGSKNDTNSCPRYLTSMQLTTWTMWYVINAVML